MPDLRSASVVHSDRFRVRDVSRFHSYRGYPYYRPSFYGHAYPFGFSFGMSFGYPYYAGFHNFWAPYNSVYVAFPFVGYYYSYPYPYLSIYSHYDCDFYDGYYVRFGRWRTSYYASCSGYGCHEWNHHHSHVHACSVHGSHHYHVRDCSLCYPEGDSHVRDDLQVPDIAAEAVSAPASPPQAEAAPSVLLPAEAVEPEPRPVSRQEAFFASLKPAQLSFALGLVQFRNGGYGEASESFYNASIEDPESKLVKVFLGVSLFAVGEYQFAAEYLRLGLEEWPTFPTYRWSVQGLYGSSSDLGSQLALLEEETRRNPGDVDAALVLAFLGMSGAPAPSIAVGESVDRVRLLSEDPVDQILVDRYVAEIEARSGLFPAATESNNDLAMAASVEDPTMTVFLQSLELGYVPALPIR